MEGPYREGKPLSELIAPDRRRERSLGLVLGGMITGALLLQVGRWVAADRPAGPAPEPPTPPAPTAEPLVTGAIEPGPLTSEEVQRVVAAHRARVKELCWDRRADVLPATDVTLTLVVGAGGDVVSARAVGNDTLVAFCVEAQARRWQFPAHGERSGTITIPFRFVRQ